VRIDIIITGLLFIIVFFLVCFQLNVCFGSSMTFAFYIISLDNNVILSVNYAQDSQKLSACFSSNYRVENFFYY